MNAHLMLDFETLGHLPPNIATLSLGVVMFNADAILEKQYFVYNMEEQLYRNRKISASTLGWWLKQSTSALSVMKESFDGPNVKEKQVLDLVTTMIGTTKDSVKVWSNGAGFDVPILENQFRLNGMEPPWKFFNVRCYRTMKAMFGIEFAIPREGTKHNALDDAIYQAKCVQLFLKQDPKADK